MRIYCASQPPSTVIAVPVTKDDLSEQSQATASATSSGVPRRQIRVIAMTCTWIWGA